VKKSDGTRAAVYDEIPARDIQTDGQTDRFIVNKMKVSVIVAVKNVG